MNFVKRHIGINQKTEQAILKDLNCNSIQELISETIPGHLLSNTSLKTGQALSEQEYLRHIQHIAAKNKVYKTYIGCGYHDTIVPTVILRNILENPGWYTQYTPYQAEISQGRLESLLNFQTMVSDLTGLPIANASLLDESTACAEAMTMFFGMRNKREIEAHRFFVDKNIFPQHLSVLKSKAHYLGIEIVLGDIQTDTVDNSFFGALLQNPNLQGKVQDFTPQIEQLKALGIYTCIVVDIMSLALFKSPGEMGADCAVGNSQRFGVPMGFGGPHAAFFATTDVFKRNIPGRIIGVSKDRRGKYALRMALQTREQHIKREKATSNICTAQALLANMAAMYAVYHGAEGIKTISKTIYNRANTLRAAAFQLGLDVEHFPIFDTVEIKLSDPQKLKNIAEQHQLNFWYNENSVRISLHENMLDSDLTEIVAVLENYTGKKADVQIKNAEIESNLARKTDILTHPIFNTHHTETQMLRYIKSLEEKDLSLTKSIIPLGSCTMKLNATTEMIPISMPQFSQIHPFAPENQWEGYREIINTLEKELADITGFDATSLQPNSGAQGEYAGLLAIRDYQASIGQGHRDVCIIPSSAHGTNPASAVLAGLKVVVSPADENGNINLADLKAKAEEYKESLSCLMITYPSTHGIYEADVMEVCNIIHQFGGQVYMDGANMNAQVGLTSPGFLGADVCHLNLHKTFAIPHGGGGPGVGPICVKAHLAPFLPSHPIAKTGGDKSDKSVSAAPFGSASILLISYGYIKMLGAEGLRKSTEYAILNANYIKSRLEKHYDILYTGQNGRVAHELIVDFRKFKQSVGIEVADVAKRLMDYGLHAPTVSFPVAGTLMIEPTESEDKAEIDRLCDALISIRHEIAEIEEGVFPTDNNVLKNAPHTAEEAISDDWNYPYSRSKAIYPIEYLKNNKFWVPVSRIDESYGDRNLVCSCLPVEAYAQ